MKSILPYAVNCWVDFLAFTLANNRRHSRIYGRFFSIYFHTIHVPMVIVCLQKYCMKMANIPEVMSVLTPFQHTHSYLLPHITLLSKMSSFLLCVPIVVSVASDLSYSMVFVHMTNKKKIQPTARLCLAVIDFFSNIDMNRTTNLTRFFFFFFFIHVLTKHETPKVDGVLLSHPFHS